MSENTVKHCLKILKIEEFMHFNKKSVLEVQ